MYALNHFVSLKNHLSNKRVKEQTIDSKKENHVHCFSKLSCALTMEMQQRGLVYVYVCGRARVTGW